MSKHTPGPWWTYTDQACDGEPDRYVVSADGELIADCYSATHLEIAIPEPDQIGPNACLIASAPDLLEALKSVLQWSVCVPNTYRMHPGQLKSCLDIINNAEGRNKMQEEP